MKIWFDISNSPHINMFYDLIKELELEGHEVILTSRSLANTVELLDQKGLKHTVIGEHYGKNFIKKIFGFPIRVLQLRNHLRKFKPDLAVSQSSFHSPVVAKLLRIPSIYTNDNEYALGNLPSFLCATQILIPENLSVKKMAGRWVSTKKFQQYLGVKEGIYLWRKGEKIVEKRKNQKHDVVRIFIRPEPMTAQYYSGEQNFLDSTIETLQSKYEIVILARNREQMEHYRQKKFNQVQVPDQAISFDTIADICTIFIGAGGTMTREMAILGVPTISVYQDALLEVDKFLLSKGLMLHETNLTAAKVDGYVHDLKNRAADGELMEKGKRAYQFLKDEILKYDVQKTSR